MNRTVWFLTGNLGKLSEVETHLGKLGYSVRQFIVPEGSLFEPQADNLHEVAKSKIEQALALVSKGSEFNDMILVEDAGLFIDSLQGFPGVYSSFVHETIGIPGILRLLSHLKSEDPVTSANLRSAKFQAVAAMWHDGRMLFGEGTCPGHIAYKPVEGNGFGYDPIFIPLDLDREKTPLSPGVYGEYSTHGMSFGGVTEEIKQNFSHRSRALEDLFSQLPSAS